MVLLKSADERGLTFFSGYESRKGRELAGNPRAALLLHWPVPGRQVRVEGTVERLDPAESDAYWATPPAGSRASAAASPQSQVVADRAALEALVAEVRERRRRRRRARSTGAASASRRACGSSGSTAPTGSTTACAIAATATRWVIERLAPLESRRGRAGQEDLNRELIELLNELRVTLPGVQVLFAFLLIAPFSQAFERVNDLQKYAYLAALHVHRARLGAPDRADAVPPDPLPRARQGRAAEGRRTAWRSRAPSVSRSGSAARSSSSPTSSSTRRWCPRC